MPNLLTVCLALAASLALSGAPEARAQPKPAPATVRLAVIPVTNYTPLVVARDKGWFAEEGLSVSWSSVAQGAVAIEAVYGGSVEFGGSSIFEPMVARGNGLDLMFAVAGTRIRPTPPDNSALLVRTNDNIRQPADLAGKKISAGLVNSVNYVHMQEWLLNRGVNPKSVQFLEIPFPQMADALFQNRLDAVWAVEPFLTFMLKTGNARIFARPYQDNMPGMDITAYIAKESWLKANADVARRFKRAVDRATTHLNNASKEERDGWVAKFTGVKPEVVTAMTLPDFTTEFNVPSLKANLDLAVKHKMVKGFDINTMMWTP
jgi:ABC-type nitrate/sulfonate/bicarbonate transport system substrate-binding protein